MLGEAFYKQFKDEFNLKCTDKDVNTDWLSFLDFRDFEAYKKDVLEFALTVTWLGLLRLMSAFRRPGSIVQNRKKCEE
ncbi:hypothetical protein MUP59_11395, partial [Candidatus Bathyarchaeota archaeon]|nr:hypothetical protein [Candidatus Bathyarchaeota archaeon]